MTTATLILGQHVALAVFLFLALWVAGSFATAAYATARGYPGFPVLLGSLFFSPVLVLLIIALLPNRIERFSRTYSEHELDRIMHDRK